MVTETELIWWRMRDITKEKTMKTTSQAEIQTSKESSIPAGYDKQLYRIRHSCAHILAQAVLEKYPSAKLGVGPPIENGFYYDFDLPAALLSGVADPIRRICPGLSL